MISRRNRLLRLGMAMSALPALCALPCGGETIRTKEDPRLWQTVYDRTVPLSWAWEDGADSATLVFSNRVAGSVCSETVPRGAGESRGSCPQPTPANGESLVDATLVQTSGGAEIARDTATLAYVAGAGGGPITVRHVTSRKRELAMLSSPRVFVFDPEWSGDSGASGYDIAWPEYAGMRVILR